MKRLGLILGFLFLSGSLWAFSNPALVYQVGISSVTTKIVSVSTFTPGVQVDTPTLSGRVVIEVDNIDASANLWCLPVSSTTQVTNTNAGRKILPGGSWVLSVADGVVIQGGANPPTRTSVPMWCTSDGAATTKAAVTQMY